MLLEDSQQGVTAPAPSPNPAFAVDSGVVFGMRGAASLPGYVCNLQHVILSRNRETTVTTPKAKHNTAGLSRLRRQFQLKMSPARPKSALGATNRAPPIRRIMFAESRISASTKLFASAGVALALTLVVSALSLYGFTEIAGVLNTIVKGNVRKLSLAGQVTRDSGRLAAFESDAVVEGLRRDKAAVESQMQGFRDCAAAMKKELDEYSSLINTEEGRRMIGEVQQSFEKVVQNHNELYDFLNSNKPDEAARVFRTKTEPVLGQLRNQADAISQHTAARLAAFGDAAIASAGTKRWINIVVSLLAVVAGAGLLFIVRYISGPLRSRVHELAESAGQVASAAAQVASSSQSLAQGSSEQAASLEETSASTEQIN